MNYGGDILRGIRELCEFFADRCEDRALLDDLAKVASDRSKWRKGRHLFELARAKSLRGDARLEAQANFEEICGKTLCNLSGAPAPFDADSPYWVVPNALRLARQLGIDEGAVTRIVAGETDSPSPEREARPEFPLTVHWPDEAAEILESEMECGLQLESFDSDDDDPVPVTDNRGRAVRLLVRELNVLVCQLKATGTAGAQRTP